MRIASALILLLPVALAAPAPALTIPVTIGGLVTTVTMGDPDPTTVPTATASASAGGSLQTITVDGTTLVAWGSTFTLPGTTLYTTTARSLYNTFATTVGNTATTTSSSYNTAGEGRFETAYDVVATITLSDGSVSTSTSRTTTVVYPPKNTAQWTFTAVEVQRPDPTPGAIYNDVVYAAQSRASSMHGAMVITVIVSTLLMALIGFPAWLWYHFITVKREMTGQQRVRGEPYEPNWEMRYVDHAERTERTAVDQQHARDAAAEADPAPAYTPRGGEVPQYGAEEERQRLLVSGVAVAAAGAAIAKIPGAQAAPVATPAGAAAAARAWVTTVVVSSSRVPGTYPYSYTPVRFNSTMRVPDATVTSTSYSYKGWSPSAPAQLAAANRDYNAAIVGIALGIIIPWGLIALCFLVSRLASGWDK